MSACPTRRFRVALCAAVALAGMMVFRQVASAQPINGRAPWCATFPQGGTYDCAYHSLQQCMAAASGVSNQCSRNPWYDKRQDVYPRPRSPYWPFF
jgi:hypothetical protein